MFPTILVQQPEPGDIVGATVLIAGRATGHEATVVARVRDGLGHELVSRHFMCGGGTGEIGQFQTQLELPGRPSTSHGFVEIFDVNEGFPNEGPYDGKVAEMHKVIVPVVFGTHIVDAYVGFTYRMVVQGDTLSKIATEQYGDAAKWSAIFEANRDQIGDADLISTGQRLRIPHYFNSSLTTVDVYFQNTARFAVGTEPYEVAVERRVPSTTPATGALHALFAGPTAHEQAQDLAVCLSEATGFGQLSITGGIARVHLVGGCDSGGSTYTIANQITPTLKQFPTVSYVKIYDPDGHTASPDGPSDSIPAGLNP